MIKTIAASLFALAVLAAAGCNTIEGAGKDVERAGEKVQGAVQDTRR